MSGYNLDLSMDLVALSADLSTQSYLHIVKSKLVRQHNRALFLDMYTDYLPPNRVPAMVPSAHFEDDTPRFVFDYHIHEAKQQNQIYGLLYC